MIKCCKIDSVISVGKDRQITLPEGCCEIGDKMTVIDWLKDGKTCCICLVKGSVTIDEYAEMIKKVSIK
ncbi:MAG: hypothetical protein HY756_06980 [Nitrospirae bacterium]|nr:hypothetical protein [Nitrospirota bacterium]